MICISNTDVILDKIQRHTFDYFRSEANPHNGLVADRSGGNAPASIAATGAALACYPIGVERGYWSRAEATQRTLATLRFFEASEQSSRTNATGYQGFYYHFLDLNSGQRIWKCELSTLDSALLVAGMLAGAQYFDLDNAEEREIRDRAETLYRRVDWQWACAGGPLLTQGWKPGSGFLPTHYNGYDETLLMHMLALGSPTHALEPATYEAYTRSYQWKHVYGHEHLVAGPLFIHQLSHAWIDFRGLQDAFMREKNCDYFENSRRATYAQRDYARHNPGNFKGYGDDCWGISASDGPGEVSHVVDGQQRQFHAYQARGVPDGPDDGTLTPRAAIASLPFAPEIVGAALEYYHLMPLMCGEPYGCRAAFNLTFPTEDGEGWLAPDYIGLDEGTVLMLLENYRTGLLWELMRGCSHLKRGLLKAGFEGGWLG